MTVKKIKPGSVFMITGGAKGIGASTAELVVQQGGRAAVCDVDRIGIETLSKKLGSAAIPIPLDVRDRDNWDEAADQVWEAFGGVDVLVNNAGRLIGGEGHLLPIEKHREMIEVNLLGPILGIHTLVPRFLEQKKGHVVNVGSFASFAPAPGIGCYCATKHALRAFSHTCALELADTPVGFTLVCPAAVETPMLEGIVKDDSAALVFAETPMPARRIAEAIIRASVEKPYEILIPASKGAFLKHFGLYPGLVKRTVSTGFRKGKDELKRRRQLGSVI